MSPLKLNARCRRFFEALVDLNATDVNSYEWLTKYRLVKRIKQVEGKAVVDGWRCFYKLHIGEGGLPLEVAEQFY